MPGSRYGVGEWYGTPIEVVARRNNLQATADAALGARGAPPCPFDGLGKPCKKKGGVCSLRPFEEQDDGRGLPQAAPAIVCPKRFEQDTMVVRWLADILDYPPDATRVAREVPFMRSVATRKPAGKIDLVVARSEDDGQLRWCALEIQAVYFSGPGMSNEFRNMAAHTGPDLPFPTATRRPDWRSSSAKRLLPQLQVKVPTIRRWAAKMAVAVDRAFFDAIGGPSSQPNQDLDSGDIIWLVPEMYHETVADRFWLRRGHWEVQTLEEASNRLLAADTVPRTDFEAVLRDKLETLPRSA